MRLRDVEVTMEAGEMIQQVPEGMYFLRSARLGFRCWDAADVDLALGLWGDAVVTRYIGGPFSVAEVQQRLAREVAFQQGWGVQYWPLFLLATGAHVGCCGLRPYRVEAQVFELGFHLCARWWGQGFAQEAAQAVIGFAFRVRGVAGLFAGHHPDNVGSRRLLGELGFRYTHDELYAPTGRYHPSYELTLAEFLASQGGVQG